MSKRKNKISDEQQYSPTTELMSELEIYSETINLLATRINRNSFGGSFSSILIIKLWPFHKFVCKFWLDGFNPLFSWFYDFFSYLIQESDFKNHIYTYT